MNKNQYSDLHNNMIELMPEELTYFYDTVNRIKNALKIECNISNYNHDLIGGHKNALGICYTDDFKQFFITVDNYYIHECFIGYDFLSGQTLDEVICHEIAHMTVWRHGKKHTELMNKYLEIINRKEVAA